MMKHFSIPILFLLFFTTSLKSQQFLQLATDPAGDADGVLFLDATELRYRYDALADYIEFKLTVTDINSVNEVNFGVVILLNIPSGANSFNYWGGHNKNEYHKIVPIWVTGNPPNNYTGIIGVGDGNGVTQFQTTFDPSSILNLHQDNVDINVNTDENAIYIGVQRQHLITNAEMSGPSISVATAAAIDSYSAWNDDIFNPDPNGGVMTITPVNVGLEELPLDDLSIYPNPIKADLTIEYSTTEKSGVVFELYDPLGRKKYQETRLPSNSGKQSLKLAMPDGTFPAGMYVLKIISNDKVMSRKLIKTH